MRMSPAIGAIVASAAMAFFPVRARADWAYTKWCMTPEQIASASKGAVGVIAPGKREQLKELDQETAAQGSYSDGPIRMRVAFRFHTKTHGLVCVGYGLLDKGQNELLKESLVKRFGNPQHTSGLPAVGMQTLTWDKPDEIELNLVSDQPALVFQCTP